MADNKTSIILTAEDRASKTIKDVGGALQNLAGSAVPAAAALSSLSAGAALTGLSAIAKTAIDAADSLGDLSQKTGIAVKDLAGYKLAAEQSGTSLDGVARGMKAMSTAMFENGKALKAAGITATDTSGAMRQLADLFSALPDGAEKSAIATKLLGKAGQDLIPLLNLGSQGLDESAKAAERYGAAMSTLAPQADAFNDSMAALSLNLQAMGAEMAGQIAPVLGVVAQAMADASKESGSLSAAGTVLKTVFETVAILGANVGFVLHTAGIEIGAWAAQINALAHLDLTGFKAISEAVKEDSERARAELDKFEQRVMSPVKQLSGPKILDARDLRLASQATLEAALRAKKLDDAIKAAGHSAKEAKDELGDLLNKLSAKDSGLDASFWKDLQTLNAGYKAGKLDIDAYRGAVAQLVTQQKFNTDALQAAAKAEDEWQKSVDKARQAAADGVIALQDRAAALEGELSTYGLTKSAIEDTIIARLEEQRALASGWDSQEELVANLEKEIDARKRAAAAMRGIEGRDLAKQAAEDAARAWENFARDIEQSLTDSLYRAFENGKDPLEAFADSIKNTFKTMVLKVAVQAVVSPVLAGAQSLLGGNLGAGGTVGGAGSLLSTGSSAYNLWNAVSGTTGAAYSTGAYMASGMGYQQAAMLAAQETGLGAAATAATLEAAGSPFLSAASTAAPYVAAALAIASMFSKESTPHVGGLAFGSESGYVSPDSGDAVLQYLNNSSRANSRVPLSAYNFTEEDWLKRENQAVSGQLGKLSQSLAQHVNAITRQYGAGSGYSVGLAYSADGDDGSRGRFGIIRDGAILASSRQRYDEDMQQGLAEFFADIPSEILQGLRDIDLSPVVDGFLDLSMAGATDVLEGMSDATANALIGALQGGWLDEFLAQMDTAGRSFADITADIIEFSSVANLKPVFDALGLSIYEVGSQLADLTGGADALGAGLAAYYDIFYSAQEKAERAFAGLAESFGDLDVALPGTRGEFRALAESLDLTTERGRATYAALVSLAPAFDQIIGAAEDARTAMLADLAPAPTEASVLAQLNAALGTSLKQLPVANVAEAWLAGLNLADPAQLAQFEAVREVWADYVSVLGDVESVARRAAGAQADAAAAQASAVDAALAALQRSVDAERNGLTAAYESSRDRLAGVLDGVADKLGKLGSLSASLQNAAEAIRPLGYNEAQAKIETALAIARAGGPLPLDGQLDQALQALSRQDANAYASRADMQRDQARTANALAGLSAVTDDQLTVEERTKALIEDQLDVLERTYRAEIDRLDGVLAAAQRQVDALNGIDTTLKTVPQALADLAAAIAAIGGAAAPRSGSSSYAAAMAAAGAANVANLQASDPYYASQRENITAQAISAAAQGNVESTKALAAEALQWGSAQQIASEVARQTGDNSWTADKLIQWARENDVPGYASGGIASGLSLVGERGPELIVTPPARVFSNADTRSMFDIAPLLDEIKALRDDLRAGQGAIAGNTRKTFDALDGVIRGAQSFLTRTTA